MSARALLLSLALAGIAAAAQPLRAGCPEPAAPPESVGERLAAEPRLAAQIEEAAAECRAALELTLGELRLALGRPEAALAPLIQAIAEGPDLRGRAFAALGRAQAAAGQTYEAFRSLSVAQTLLASGDPERADAVAAASLLVRFHLLRGGTEWGAWRFEPEYSVAPGERKLDPIALAAGATVLAAAGKGGTACVAGECRFPTLPPKGRVAALAADPRGAIWILLEDSTLLGPHGSRHPLGLKERPRSLAVGPLEEAAVVAGGRVHRYARAAAPAGEVPGISDAVAVAIDPRGVLHVLRSGAEALTRLLPDGRPLHALAAVASGWSLRDPDALAVDRFGHSYVLTRNSGLVWLFDSAGRGAGFIAAPPDRRGLISGSRSLAVDPAGRLYLLRGSEVVRYR